MSNNVRLMQIEESIKKYNPEAITKIIECKKLKKQLLFVFTKGSHNKVQLFDDVNGLNEIGIIGYSRTKNTNISTFEVKKHYQGKGLGRFLFEFALAHVDKLGVTSVHGDAMPINDIKGVKGVGMSSHTAHKIKLVEIYKKLGCSIEDVNLEEDEYPTFTLNWKSGERFDKADNQIQELVTKVIESQKIIDKNNKYLID